MKLRTLFPILALAFSLTFAFTAFAETTTNLVITPSSTVFDGKHIVGVKQDAAPGFNFGSFASDGVDKTDMYFTPEMLFKRDVKIGEIESISYWTKKGTTHSVNLVDWALVIYTKPYSGDVSSATWYGDRIGAEPYFASGMNDPANTWNQWNTDGPENQLRFYESTAGASGATFGTYMDPFWSDFKQGNALSGQSYATRDLLFFSIQTGSATAPGFTGQLDGARIELTDGSVATINFEPFLVPNSPDACKKDGYLTLKRPDESPFATQGDCVSFARNGK